MTLRLNGSTSGYTEIDAPAVAGSNTIVLPSGNGSANQLLKNGSTAGSLEFSSSVYIDSSQRLLVGTSTAFSVGGAAPYAKVQIKGNTVSDFGILTIATNEANSTLVSGDDIGKVVFSSSDGSEYATISALADGTAGSSDYPGRLTFSTTADGASSPTERMRILNSGEARIQSVYDLTTSSGANVFVYSNGAMVRSTSSAKYKTNIEAIEDSYSDALLQCRPVWYQSTSAKDNPEWGWWGFIAEEVAEIDPRLVHWKTTEVSYDEKGSAVETPCEPEPEGVQYERFVPHLLNLIKRQKEQIDAMEARLSALEAS